MKEFGKYALLLGAGFALGFAFQSLIGVTMRKARNRVFLAESSAELEGLRAKIKDFKAQKRRFPRGPDELYQARLLEPSDPPMESLRRSSRWTGDYDGQGGFLYLSPTGELRLNVDLSRDKFFSKDWKLIKEGDLLPKGALY